MAIDRPGAENELDGPADPLADVTRNTGRWRLLLGAATSGIVLATSGLLLPEWLVEKAEADEGDGLADHPVRNVQHRADKRRQRRHHRLKQKRRRQQRPADGRTTNLKDYWIKRVNLTVINNTSETLSLTDYMGNGNWVSQGDQTLSAFGGRYEQTDNSQSQGVLFKILNHPFLSAFNPVIGTPFVRAEYGGSLGTFAYNDGTTAIDNTTLSENQETRVVIPFSDTFNVSVTMRRDSDSTNYKNFTITLANA